MRPIVRSVRLHDESANVVGERGRSQRFRSCSLKEAADGVGVDVDVGLLALPEFLGLIAIEQENQ